MYAHVFVLPTTAESPQSADWSNVRTVPLTKYELRQANTFQLIGDSVEAKVHSAQFVILLSFLSHPVTILTSAFSISK